MHVIVNGEPREVSPTTTLADLIAELGLPADGIAAAVDHTVVPRTQHADTPLTEGCRIEIIRAVGGG